MAPGRGKQKGGKEAIPVAKAADAAIEEDDDDDNDAGSMPTGGGARQFVWDAALGCLVDRPIAETKESSDAKAVASNDSKEESVEKTGEEKEGEAKDGEEESTEDDSDEEEGNEVNTTVDADTASRMAFLNEASTPELIKQAVAIGGSMAAGVSDRWVVDKATQLSFRYDSSTRQMHCWNPSQNYMYLWKGRGKLEFLWTPSQGAGNDAMPPVGGAPPPPTLTSAAGLDASADSAGKASSAVVAASSPATPGSASATAAATSAGSSEAQALWVTVLPPSVLDVAVTEDPSAVLTEEVDCPTRALGHIIGKNNSSLKELETHSGAAVSVRSRGEEEQAAHVVIQGTKAQIASAKLALEQKLVLALGEKKMERLQKHQNSMIVEKKRNESGADAAIGGVEGLREFAEKWKLKAVLVRKLRKLDAMLQKYLVKHFKPWKAKPENALRSYTTVLMMHPQRWRLEALNEMGELDGDTCETAVVNSDRGAIVGLQRSAVQEILGDDAPDGDDDEQMIELEIDDTVDNTNRVFGDVQPQHAKLVKLGDNFYAMALESRIGTVVDGRKYRQTDGPVPIRDGTTIAVGKYLLFCEVGSPSTLQDRRTRLMAGESLWKIIKASGSNTAESDGSVKETEATAPSERILAEGGDDADATLAATAGNAPLNAAADALAAMIDDDDVDADEGDDEMIGEDAEEETLIVDAHSGVGPEEIAGEVGDSAPSKLFDATRGQKRKAAGDAADDGKGADADSNKAARALSGQATDSAAISA
eukprot:TRINITY_DN19497_c0_g1_i1.p1 TRINITY_DN19497_c0_g1~~TRINITY_DN19497_c0_g1_i1.p1  ORF type:complete len:762 (-),score=163.20 TRINITY_DN19497_c0_g1_i1:39-2324(-)